MEYESYDFKSKPEKSTSSIDEMKINTEDEQSSNENLENYSYDYKSKLEKSASSIDEMKINTEDEQSSNENLENYSYDYKSKLEKFASSIDEMKINTEDEQSSNENFENYNYDYSTKPEISFSSIDEMKINLDEENNLNENSENYSYEHKSDVQKSFSSINVITINSDDEKETGGLSAELGSQMLDKNRYSSTQENPEIEIYIDELQTSKMRIRSTDTTETSAWRSDRSWMADDLSKTSDKKHRVQADLKKLLLDLTTGYLMEGAEDLVNYGLEYFNRLKKCRGTWPTGSWFTGDKAYDSDDGSRVHDESRPEHGEYGHRTPGSGTVDDDDDDDDDYDDGGGGVPVQTFAKSDEQRRALTASVRDVLVFRAMDEEQTVAVIDAMSKLDVLEDDVIFKQGDVADEFYVVEVGTYEERVAYRGYEERVVRTYAGSGSFGELALLCNWPRATTVVAATAGALWTVNRRTFGRVVRRTSRDRRDMLDRLVRAVPMFDALEPRERARLADALRPRHYGPGDLVVGQGGPGDGMYFVERGTVVVHAVDRTGTRRHVNTVREGGHFGELALITDDRRAASVHADGHVKLAFLDVRVFERLLGPCLDIMKRRGGPCGHQSAAATAGPVNSSDLR